MSNSHSNSADDQMLHFDPKGQGVRETHPLIIGGIGPRPIALVSTVSTSGVNNLAPFSFFNAFSSNPPVIAFSPARSGRDGHLKDTYNNLVATQECVVQVVTYNMVEQVNLASTEYAPEVDEFVKSGFTPIDSLQVKPKRVKESPFQMECKLRQMIPLGDQGGAGNLAICDVIQFHIDKKIYNDGKIHPNALDLVGRQGGDFYVRASGAAIFEVGKPHGKMNVGFDGLPEFMKSSYIYTTNNLGRFALAEKMPSRADINSFFKTIEPLPGNERTFDSFEKERKYQEMLLFW